jgi:hypothetical protein
MVYSIWQQIAARWQVTPHALLWRVTHFEQGRHSECRPRLLATREDTTLVGIFRMVLLLAILFITLLE